jgi:hypothetical protein
MESADDTEHAWPALSYRDWRDTAATLQLWTQIVGKVRLALSPWLNHGWHVPLYVNARGLGTSPIHAARRIFEIDFDLSSIASSCARRRRANGASRSNRCRLRASIDVAWRSSTRRASE